MKEFIDKTDVIGGTPINRVNLMAIQGFEGKRIIFNDDATIVETNEDGDTLTTTFNADGSITEEFKGVKIIKKTTTITENEILEVIS